VGSASASGRATSLLQWYTWVESGPDLAAQRRSAFGRSTKFRLWRQTAQARRLGEDWSWLRSISTRASTSAIEDVCADRSTCSDFLISSRKLKHLGMLRDKDRQGIEQLGRMMPCQPLGPIRIA
jgi:hypothetical protein